MCVGLFYCSRYKERIKEGKLEIRTQSLNVNNFMLTVFPPFPESISVHWIQYRFRMIFFLLLLLLFTFSSSLGLVLGSVKKKKKKNILLLFVCLFEITLLFNPKIREKKSFFAGVFKFEEFRDYQYQCDVL